MTYTVLLTRLLRAVTHPSAWPCCALLRDPKENSYTSLASLPVCKKGTINLPVSLPVSPSSVQVWGSELWLFVTDVRDGVIASSRYFLAA